MIFSPGSSARGSSLSTGATSALSGRSCARLSYAFDGSCVLLRFLWLIQYSISVWITSDRIHQPERRRTQGSFRLNVRAARKVEMRGAIARALSARVAAIGDGLPVRVA